MARPRRPRFRPAQPFPGTETELLVFGARLYPLPASIRNPAVAEIERLYDEYEREYGCYGLLPDCARPDPDHVMKDRMLAAIAGIVRDAEASAMLLPKPPRHRLPR